MSRSAIALVAAVFTMAILAAAALGTVSARPKPGHYAGTTSECLEAGSEPQPVCNVTYNITDHGKRVTGFTTGDGYNGMCQFVGSPPHIFAYSVKVTLMRVKSNGSFTGTVKSILVPGPGGLSGTFRVNGRFSSGKAHGTVTRIGRRATNCGSGASNPTTSDYLETFTASPTK